VLAEAATVANTTVTDTLPMSTVYRRVSLRWDVECYVINIDDTVLGQVLCLLMHASQLADVATVSVVGELQQSVSIKWVRSLSRDGITPVRHEMTWTSLISSGVKERREQFWSVYIGVARCT